MLKTDQVEEEKLEAFGVHTRMVDALYLSHDTISKERESKHQKHILEF